MLFVLCRASLINIGVIRMNLYIYYWIWPDFQTSLKEYFVCFQILSQSVRPLCNTSTQNCPKAISAQLSKPKKLVWPDYGFDCPANGHKLDDVAATSSNLSRTKTFRHQTWAPQPHGRGTCAAHWRPRPWGGHQLHSWSRWVPIFVPIFCLWNFRKKRSVLRSHF